VQDILYAFAANIAVKQKVIMQEGCHCDCSFYICTLL